MPRLVRFSAELDRLDAVYLSTLLRDRSEDLRSLADRFASGSSIFGAADGAAVAARYRRNADRIDRLRRLLEAGAADV